MYKQIGHKSFNVNINDKQLLIQYNIYEEVEDVISEENEYIGDEELNEIIEELAYLNKIDDDPYKLKTIRKAALSR